MHILVIPYSYPNTYNEVGNVFFRDHARALVADSTSVGVLSVVLVSFKDVIKRKRWEFGLRVERRGGVEEWIVQWPSIPKLRRFNNFVRRILTRRVARQYVKAKGAVSIIHGHGFIAGDALRAVSMDLSVPYVITEHASHFGSGTLDRWQKQLALRTFTGASARMAVSEPFCAMLAAEGFGQFQYVPNVVDVSEFQMPAHTADPPTFISIGSFIDRKNHRALIDAFAAIASAHPKVRLVLGGGGPEESALRHQVERLHLAERVSIFGKLSRQQIAELLRRSTIFVLPSKVETFGVVLIEAMAAGLPVVATACGGPESIVTSDAVGRLVPVGDDAALRSAMTTVLAQRFDRQQIRHFARTNFSAERVRGDTLAIYQSVLSGKSHAPV